ncbi:MAG: hypothetical protein R3C68_07235 [Myxococcota bacterium]
MMTFITTPLPILLAACVGCAGPFRRMAVRMQQWIARNRRTQDGIAPASPSADLADVKLSLFALLQVLCHIGALSLPGVPIYGGVKLFLPAFPFIAVLAGLGFAATEQQIRQRATKRFTLYIASIAVLALLPGIIGIARYRGAWLSYYNAAVGGLRGATDAGYERQYYDLAYPQIAQGLNKHRPQGGQVAVLPNPKEYVHHFSKWHQLRQLDLRIRLVDINQADFLVLTHERRWATYSQIKARYEHYPQLYRLDVDGVPLVSIFDLREPVR